jgi:ankyrin repeat protein
MVKLELHQLARHGDVVGLRDLLSRHPAGYPQINEYDPTGRTPLMVAVSQPAVPVEMVNLLLANGSDIFLTSRERFGPSATVMDLALGAGNPDVIRLLLRAGAPLETPKENGYTALIHAVHSRDVYRDARLIELLHLLIGQGAELNVISSYGESGLRVLSRLGRFDAVKVLLDAGADSSQLEWTPLHRAVALGTLEEVRSEVEAGDSLEERDRWQRTPWLLALQTGEFQRLSSSLSAERTAPRGDDAASRLSFTRSKPIACPC